MFHANRERRYRNKQLRNYNALLKKQFLFSEFIQRF